MIDHLLVPWWVPDDFDLAVVDIWHHEHFGLDAFGELWADGTCRRGEGHDHHGKTVFIDFYLIDESKVNEADSELGIDYFIEDFVVVGIGGSVFCGVVVHR